MTIITGDESARQVASSQPMKLAAMEGLYYGTDHAPLIAIGALNGKPKDSTQAREEFAFKFEIPSLLSYMAFLDAEAFVPGIHDLVHGNAEEGIMSAKEKMQRGEVARKALSDYKDAKENGETEQAAVLLAKFNNDEWLAEYFKYFGYSYFDDPHDLIPNVPIIFYSFHLMVTAGGYLLMIFAVLLFLAYKNILDKKRWILRAVMLGMPAAWLATESGWVVAEVGRQPWVIQDLMPTMTAVSNINTASVQITFALFFIVFAALLIAEIKIMLKQIKLGPNQGGH